MDDDFFWPEWVEELYDNYYESTDRVLYLSQSEEEQDWEFLMDE